MAEEAEARALIESVFPASMAGPALVALRAEHLLREHVFSLRPGHVLSQGDIIKLRVAWREAREARDALALAEARSGECALAGRVLSVVHNEDKPVENPEPAGADTDTDTDTDFEEA